MSQPPALSTVEAVANVAVGFGIALVAQLALFPRDGLQATLCRTLVLALGCTGVSFLRSHVLRRLFDRIGAG